MPVRFIISVGGDRDPVSVRIIVAAARGVCPGGDPLPADIIIAIGDPGHPIAVAVIVAGRRCTSRHADVPDPVFGSPMAVLSVFCARLI